jgi:serine/threonine-protein phosphatase PP1 catalytic subunit
MFIMDLIIYWLYHEIVSDRTKYPKSVPFVDLPYEMVEFLIKKVQKCFEDEKPLVQFEAPVKIFGDIHGQYTDLLHMFKEMGDKNKQEQQDYILSKNTRYLFMGDYVNRGKQSCEVICLLFALKVRYPQ